LLFGTLGGGASFGTLLCFGSGIFRRRPLICPPLSFERLFIGSP
jgi:hypothetical protein